MKSSKLRIIGLGLGLVSILIVTSVTYPSSSIAVGPTGKEITFGTQSWQNKVDASVLSKASTGKTQFLIYMEKQADLSGAEALTTKAEKGEYVFRQLTAVANETQPAVRQTLQTFGTEFRSFWVTNAIWAKGDLGVLQAIALRPEVAYVFESGGGSLSLPAQEKISEAQLSREAANLAAQDLA